MKNNDANNEGRTMKTTWQYKVSFTMKTAAVAFALAGQFPVAFALFGGGWVLGALSNKVEVAV